ncbi:uncharacterized protein LOC142325838 [Lycorma delicatula]|uniref:uncharacterized protein LOC142325838 n=1 Tax=Lycorma delicatula TaxID=130591 RepID=UPI003F50EB67
MDITYFFSTKAYYDSFLSTSMTGTMYIYATIYRQNREISRSTDFDSSTSRIVDSSTVRHVKKVLNVKGNVDFLKVFEANLEMKNLKKISQKITIYFVVNLIKTVMKGN